MVNLLDDPPDIITVVDAPQWQKVAALGHDFHRGGGFRQEKDDEKLSC